MTVHDILRHARRWWWVLALCPLVAAATAYVISDAAARVYRAELTLLVEESQALGTSDYNDILANERRAQTYSRLVRTRPVLDETIGQLGLALTSDELEEMLSVAPIDGTQLISVSVSDESPERAADIANTIGEVFVAQAIEQQAALAGSGREELQRNIDEITSQIDETSAAIDALRQRADAASAAVQAEVVTLQSRLNQLQITYSSLLEAQQRMDIAQSQTQTQIRVAEQAIAPDAPVSPRVTLNTALGGTLGLMLAGGLVVLLGYLDNTIRTSDDLRRLTGQAALGEIPMLSTTDGVMALSSPQSAEAEAYRTLRTNLQFATLGREVRSIVVTSLHPGDGKTTTIANLATVLAQGGQSVILVDADLRKPRVHRLFGLSNRMGLTNLLLSPVRDSIQSALQPTPTPGLLVATSGPLPPNPSDVLQSRRMVEILDRLEVADFVLVDSPPVAVSDPLITAGIVDGVLLVMSAKRTRPNEVLAAIESISRTGTPLLGIVINRVSLSSTAYAYYRSYAEMPSQTPASLDDAARPRPAGRSRTMVLKQLGRFASK
jgi:non-specific protein-tyrosine kinase